MNLAKTTFFITTDDQRAVDAEDKACPSYLVYRDAAHCPYCGAARFRLRSTGRRQPYFACDGCGQRLEI
jgi:hypothetical protein